jgi:hypothetical protein
MSRAHAVAPMRGALVLTRGSAQGVKTTAPRVVDRHERPVTSSYLERAMLLWPRLDRVKLRRVADDPLRIAEMIQGRTSQPFEVIVAMLTRQTEALTSPTEESSGFASGRTDAARVALRIVRSDSGTRRELRDLLRA